MIIFITLLVLSLVAIGMQYLKRYINNVRYYMIADLVDDVVSCYIVIIVFFSLYELVPLFILN